MFLILEKGDIFIIFFKPSSIYIIRNWNKLRIVQFPSSIDFYSFPGSVEHLPTLLSVEDIFLSITTHLLHLRRKAFWSGQIGYLVIPIPSMYVIFTYISHKNQPNVGKYTIHGWYGIAPCQVNGTFFVFCLFLLMSVYGFTDSTKVKHHERALH